MDVVWGVEALPLAHEAAAVSIGFFDGVHVGHQRVIGRMVDVARKREVAAVAVTFDRHPLEVLSPGKAPPRLTTTERKAELIAGLGADTLVVLEFTEEFSRWPAEEFAKVALAAGLHAEHVVVGANFTFGHRAMGNVALLRELEDPLGFTTEAVPLVLVDGRTVSSTSVREALAAGDVEWPKVALGRPHEVEGTVGRGAGRGAGLGWPTANIEPAERLLLPADGVYAGRARHAGGVHTAAINVGTNPTFGEEPLHAEAFLLDFEGDLLGRPIAVEFWRRLRDEVRFDTADDLSRQIAEDVRKTREVMESGG